MRRKDWEDRLGAYLGQQRGAVFAYGQLDEVLFAAGAIEAMTGEDPAAHIRGHYTTRLGALRVLRREGYRNLIEAMDARYLTVPPAHAQRGDIALHDCGLGVCIGRDALFVGIEDGREGLVRLPMREWDMAWRIPFAGEIGRRD